MEDQFYGGLHPTIPDFPLLSKPFVFLFKKYGDNLARNCGLSLTAERDPQLTASKKVLKPQRKEFCQQPLSLEEDPEPQIKIAAWHRPRAEDPTNLFSDS